MADFNTVAQQFVKFYYETFDENRQNLAALYRDHSMLSFEGQQFQGTTSILEKLSNLPFEKVVHQVNTQDAQPSNQEGGIVVMVSGALKVDAEERPMNYAQVFQLYPEGGSFFVFNDVFRLIY